MQYIGEEYERDLQYYVRPLKITCNIANLLLINRNFICQQLIGGRSLVFTEDDISESLKTQLPKCKNPIASPATATSNIPMLKDITSSIII